MSFTRLSRLLQSWLPLAIILVAGAYLRLYRVGELPPGLFHDEGAYGLDALRVLRGEFHLYFAANNGREGLFMYLLALGIAALGRTPESLRIVSAGVGIATLVAIYFAGRNLFSHRVGVLSAGILAITFWHVALSRVAFRAITLPLLLCVFVALAAYAFKGRVKISQVGAVTDARHRLWQRQPARFVISFLAGVAFGLTFYTYTSGQFVLWLVLAFGLIALATVSSSLVNSDSQGRKTIAYAIGGVGVCGAALTLAPFAVWLTQHSDLYFARAGQVSILNPAINGGDLLGTLVGNISKAAGMFFIQGDRIGRHNLPWRPVFEGALALAFLIGMGVCVWQAVRPRRPTTRLGSRDDRRGFLAESSAVLLLWLITFLIPTILAEDTPHFLRGIGALPAACVVCAIGLEWALGQASRRGLLTVPGRISRWVSPPALIAAVLITVSGIKTYSDYFTVYVTDPATGYWLANNDVAIPNAINTFLVQRPAGTVIIQRHLASSASVRFLAPSIDLGRTFVIEDAPTELQPMQWKPDKPGTPDNAEANYWLLIVDPNRDWSAIRNALPSDAVLKITEGPLAKGDLDPSPFRSFIAIQLTPRLSQGLDRARFEQGIRLNFADQRCNPQTPEDCAVALTWRTEQPINKDYAVYVHWLREGQLIAQHDGSPGAGYWPMNIWRIGDLVADEFALRVPGGGKPFDEVRVGIYDRVTGTRLNVLDANGNAMGDSVIISSPR